MISKKALLALHSWVGLKLSLLMFIVCLTGTFAVISHELDWLFTEELRVTSQDDKAINWTAIHDNLQKTYPKRKIVFIDRPLYSNFASIVSVIDPELGVRRVFVDPYTGQVKGDAPHYASFQRTLRDLHRYLLSPIGGIYLVTPLALILLISVISALFFYKKWWKGFFKLKLDSGTRAFWGSLHKVVGLWSLWFLLLMGLTGTWYLVEGIVDDADIDIQEPKVVVSASDYEGNRLFEEHINAGIAVIIAKQAIPNFKPERISFANTQDRIIKITGHTDSVLVRARANSVSINPVTGEVLQIRQVYNESVLSIWIDMADALHFGNFSGLFVKLIWFVFGLLTCVMSVSGVIIFIKRIKNKKQGSWIKNIFAGMKYVVFSLLIIPIFFGTLHTLYALNMFAYVEHDYQIALSKADTNKNIPEAKLYVANAEKKSIIRLEFDCVLCLMQKHEIELLLNDGSTIGFKNSFIAGYRGAGSAFIETEKLPLIKSVIINYGKDKKIYLYPIKDSINPEPALM